VPSNARWPSYRIPEGSDETATKLYQESTKLIAQLESIVYFSLGKVDQIEATALMEAARNA
jgi:hypothetical protein